MSCFPWAVRRRRRAQSALPRDLLRPYPEEEMESWRVSDKVGNAKSNWTELIEPVPEDAPKKKPKRTKPKKDLPPDTPLFD